MRKIILSTVLGIALVGCRNSVTGPDFDASLSGRVVSRLGYGLVNAQVVLFSGGDHVMARTDIAGHYEFPRLISGSYELEILAGSEPGLVLRTPISVEKGVNARDWVIPPG